KSGVGIGDRPPQVGDPPQVWVEVDLTRPTVQLTDANVVRGTESGRVAITWKATDKNLGRQPISLSYAAEPTGPWTSIANNLENSGRFVWQLESTVPW